ncbi:putative 2OG-Fe(II) oxygenase [Elongatibacter sediminis]|uniref:2OG-Fe(II) oxygenase n=1 Tax=Elongatibacter sediminis TaxID=3119006 RepID=A0AAW9RCC5_9GAMM
MSATASKPEIRQWGSHATPVFSTRYPSEGVLNRELRKFILDQESQGERYRNPDYIPSNQVGIFESSFDLFKDLNRAIQELKGFFLHGILHAVMETNGYSADEAGRLRVMTDAWYHVTRFGGYISSHIHSNATWSAVYMVDPGVHPDDRPAGGVLNFKDPRVTANMYLDPGNQQWRPPYHLGSVNYEMKPGDLLVFPSFIQHEVTPYFGEAPRITVAANCSFRWQDS